MHPGYTQALSPVQLGSAVKALSAALCVSGAHARAAGGQNDVKGRLLLPRVRTDSRRMPAPAPLLARISVSMLVMSQWLLRPLQARRPFQYVGEPIAASKVWRCSHYRCANLSSSTDSALPHTQCSGCMALACCSPNASRRTGADTGLSARCCSAARSGCGERAATGFGVWQPGMCVSYLYMRFLDNVVRGC